MTADTIGGVWTYAIELARALESHGVEIVLATMGLKPTPEQRRAARECGNVRLAESVFKLEWMNDPWDDVDYAADWLLRLEREHKPDIVHLNGYAHAALPWSAPVLVVAHSCVRSWWTAVRGGEAPAEWSEYTRRVRGGLAAAQLVVAPTRAMLDALTQHYRLSFAGEVIPNGRGMLCPVTDKQRLILSAGRLWDEAKNVAALARIASTIEWPVEVAGDIASPDGEEAMLVGSVRWLGRLTPSELAVHMARAAIFALPAKYEPFGLSAVEAALAGCALVLGDIPSLREVWGDAAMFVSPYDDDRLIAAIQTLCRNRSLRSRLSASARTRALELNPTRMGDAYAALYARMSATVPEAACAS